jgi:ABC-2 type transport system permease protein
MRLSKERFRGFGRVCSFTLQQLLKSRSNRATLIILFLLALLSMPVMTFISGGGIQLGGRNTVETVYLVNDTALPLELETYGLAERVVSGPGEPGERDILLTVTSVDGEFRIHTALSENSGVSDAMASQITEAAAQSVENARARSLGLSEDLIGKLSRPVSSAQATEPGLSAAYYVQLIYSIIVMMISVMSISYIIRSVVEEKVSKLVGSC